VEHAREMCRDVANVMENGHRIWNPPHPDALGQLFLCSLAMCNAPLETTTPFLALQLFICLFSTSPGYDFCAKCVTAKGDGAEGVFGGWRNPGLTSDVYCHKSLRQKLISVTKAKR